MNEKWWQPKIQKNQENDSRNRHTHTDPYCEFKPDFSIDKHLILKLNFSFEYNNNNNKHIVHNERMDRQIKMKVPW